MPGYSNIANRLNFDRALPYTKDWSAAEDFLEIIADYCLKTRPGTIIECSSGLTTLILARCCQLNQTGHVYSLENGEEYAQKTSAQLEEFGLGEFATVIHAPLEKIQLNQHEYLWYNRSQLPDTPVDMLVIDGPPGFIQKNSRYPAVPLLFNQFSNQCSVFLDDAARDDEKNIIQLWLSEQDVLQHNYVETERGCSVLSVDKD